MTAATARWAPGGATAPARLRFVPPRRLALVPAHEAPAALRLSRRGRLTVTLLVSAALVVIALSVMPAVQIGSQTDHAITVGGGQTLSEIAATQLPDLPLSQAVAQIQLANGLNSLQVQAGQTLLIPSVR